GSTAHPMHFFSLEPDLGKVEDWGHIARISGGNFPAMAVQQGVIYGAAYQGGYLYRYDPSPTWNPPEETPDPNPQVVPASRGPLSRPRALLAHPDGRRVVMGGFADDGLVGGGLGIYDVATGTSRLIPDEARLAGHSVIALRALPDGSLIGGTSVEARGGA